MPAVPRCRARRRPPTERLEAAAEWLGLGRSAEGILPRSDRGSRRGVLRTTLLFMDEPTVDRYMTPSPHTIGQDEPLSAAHELMRAHSIRHLPVLEGRALVGLVSLGDLHLLET